MRSIIDHLGRLRSGVGDDSRAKQLVNRASDCVSGVEEVAYALGATLTRSLFILEIDLPILFFALLFFRVPFLSSNS